jgi:hydrogenase-4 component E
MDGPSVFIGGANTIAVIALLVEFMMLRASLLRTQVHLYAFQSLVVSVLAVVIAANGAGSDLYVLAALSFTLKVLIVPYLVVRLLRDADVQIATAGTVAVATSVLLALGVAGFGFFAIGHMNLPSQALPTAALSTSVAIVLVAFVLMIVRNDVVSQAIGFFSLENGVSLASLVVAAGLPLILEVAFLFDLLVAVLVFGVLMRLHHRRSQTLSTQHLTSLRG